MNASERVIKFSNIRFISDTKLPSGISRLIFEPLDIETSEEDEFYLYYYNDKMLVIIKNSCTEGKYIIEPFPDLDKIFATYEKHQDAEVASVRLLLE